MTNIPDDDAVYETWDSVADKSVQLAKLIEDYCRQSGERFDAMIVIPRGSYFPVNIIARRLGFLPTDLLHACINSYEAGSSKRTEFTLGQMPTAEQITGKNLLIIDEVCDTGFTLDFLTGWLHEQGAALVRTAVLHYKPERSQTGFKPDLLVAETNDWIVYPWETGERQSSTVKRQD